MTECKQKFVFVFSPAIVELKKKCWGQRTSCHKEVLKRTIEDLDNEVSVGREVGGQPENHN